MLSLSNNCVEEFEDIVGLAFIQSLVVLDLKDNNIAHKFDF